MNVMNADWQLVQDLFEELVDAAPKERERRMSAYAPTPEVMAEALALFAASDALTDAPAKPAVAAKAPVEATAEPREAAAAPAPAPVPEPEAIEPALVAAPAIAPAAPLKGSVPFGTMFGAYRIKSMVARSERGELYVARRSDGADDSRVMIRLLPAHRAPAFDAARADRQLLGSLQNVAIARLLTGGKLSDGRPYLVSEFAEGEQLLAHVQARKLKLAKRLKLMLEICDAVSAGHRHLLVHQDLKPAHVIVTPAGKVKLVDYGLEPVIAGHLPGEERELSQSSRAYAAPEYLKGARAVVATDVYGLGAILFELLTGVAPWLTGGRSTLPDAARQLNKEPLLASTVKAVEPTVTPVEPAQLSGDLDAILAKAMRHDPLLRYDSVAAFADDIRKALSLRPVAARGAGLAYRANRLLRRNRLALIASAAALAIAGSAAFGAGTLLPGFYRSGEEQQLSRVETARDLMTLVFRSAAAGQVAGFASVRDVLDLTVRQIENEPPGAAMPPELLLAVGSTFLELEEYDGATTMLERYRSAAGAKGDVEGQAQADMLLSAAAIGSGFLDEAAKPLDAAEAFFSAAPRRYLEEQALTDGYRASLLFKTGHRADAQELLQAAINRLEQAGRGRTIAGATLQQIYGQQLMETGQFEAATAAFDRATASLAALGRENAPIAMTLEANKALLAHAKGEWAEAQSRWEDAISSRRTLYGPSDALAATQLSFGRALLARGEPLAARLRFNDALSMTTGATSQSSTVYAMLLQSRGLANLGAGDLRAAEQDLTKALEVAEALFGDKSLYYGMAVMAHAEMSFMRRDPDRARRDIAIAEPIFEMAGPAGRDQLKALTAIKKIIVSAKEIAG